MFHMKNYISGKRDIQLLLLVPMHLQEIKYKGHTKKTSVRKFSKCSAVHCRKKKNMRTSTC